jgi:hypothetical protein
MIIKRAVSLAFTAACLTAIAALPAHAQGAAQWGPGFNPGGNSVGVPGPNPGGPGLTPYTGGAYGAAQPYPSYPPAAYGAAQPYPSYPPAAYGATQPYPTRPSAAGTNTEVLTNGPQGSPPPNWSAQQNVRESERYDRLLETNRAFRNARERRECGPITDSQLREQCLASFRQDEPYAGSSGATGGYGSSTSGR